MTDLITVGIDPGLSGGIAGIGPEFELQFLEDLPSCSDGKLQWIDGFQLYRNIHQHLRGRPVRFVIERVGSMPQQGVASSFKFGVTFGSILSVLQICSADQLGRGIHLVAPAKWKRAMGLQRVKDEPDSAYKARSLDKARLLYPAGRDYMALAKHEGRAEALLLAHYFLNLHRAGAQTT